MTPAPSIVGFWLGGDACAVAARGGLDERRAVLETSTGVKCAGPDLLITYSALDAARWLAEGDA